MNSDHDFVGRGWAFPLRVSPRGGIALAGGTEEIDAAIRAILLTAPGERVMRPDFGCAIWDLLFAPIEANSLGLMSQAVREAIGGWEPRVELEDVRSSPSLDAEGRVDIEVVYVIKATNDRRNLVFPFYVIPREEAS